MMMLIESKKANQPIQDVNLVKLAFQSVAHGDISKLEMIKSNFPHFNPNVTPSNSAYSLLEYAFKLSMIDRVKWFYENYEEVRNKISASNLEGDNLLHIISSVRVDDFNEDTIELVKWLIRHDCKVNAQNFKNETPLHIAAGNTPEICQVLLEYGADPNIEDYKGELPIQYPLSRSYYAESSTDLENNYVKNIGLLLAYGSDMDILKKDTFYFFAKHLEYITDNVWFEVLSADNFIRTCTNLLKNVSKLPQPIACSQTLREMLLTYTRYLISSFTLDPVDGMSNEEKLRYHNELEITKKIFHLTKTFNSYDDNLCQTIDTKLAEIEDTHLDLDITRILQKGLKGIPDSNMLSKVSSSGVFQEIISWLNVEDKQKLGLVVKIKDQMPQNSKNSSNISKLPKSEDLTLNSSTKHILRLKEIEEAVEESLEEVKKSKKLELSTKIDVQDRADLSQFLPSTEDLALIYKKCADALIQKFDLPVQEFPDISPQKFNLETQKFSDILTQEFSNILVHKFNFSIQDQPNPIFNLPVMESLDQIIPISNPPSQKFPDQPNPIFNLPVQEFPEPPTQAFQHLTIKESPDQPNQIFNLPVMESLDQIISISNPPSQKFPNQSTPICNLPIQDFPDQSPELPLPTSSSNHFSPIEWKPYADGLFDI